MDPRKVVKMASRIIACFLIAGAAQSGEGAGSVNSKLRDISLRLHWYPGGEHSYLYYGKELGLFRKAGFNVTILGGTGSSMSAKLIGSGHEDVGMVSSDYVLMGLEKGLEMKSFLTIFHKTPVTIYSLAEKNIKTLKDLYGKRLGIMLESNTYPQWQGLATTQNIDRSKIKEIPVTGPAALRMLLNDELDAHTWYTLNGPLPLRLMGHKVNEILAADYGIEMYGMSFVVGPRLMADKAAVSKIKSVIIESLKRARAEPDAAVRALLRAEKIENPELEVAKLKDLLASVYDEESGKLGIGYQTVDGWKKTAETLHKLGQLKDASVYKHAIWEE